MAKITKSFSLRDCDGAELRLSETEDRTLVHLSITRGDRHEMQAVLLTRDQWESFTDLRYSVEVRDPGEPVGLKLEAAQ